MSLSSRFFGHPKKYASILNLYVMTAVISVVTVVILSSFSFYRIFSGFVTKSAEEDSIQLCQLLRDQLSFNLIRTIPGQGEQLVVDDRNMAFLDQNMRAYLQTFNIIKIKIYDSNHRIIYSTKTTLIGKTDQNNRHLDNALSGHIDTRQVTKEKAHDLADEPLMDVDVVETYVPILSSAGMQTGRGSAAVRTLGSFETYVDVTRYREQIRLGVAVMTLITVAVLAAVFGFSYLLIRRSACRLKETQCKLEILAITDVLTGIANRRHVMARGEEEFTRAERTRVKGAEAPTLCCIMLDIDHFKHVNDTKGHPAGDEVLREVVCRLRKSVRPYDVVGRYGGEEFLILLPDTLFEEAMVVAERIRIDIRSEPFAICGEDLCISVSLGISCFHERDSSLNDLLKRADEGLYKAKHAGRDRVEWVYVTHSVF